MAKKIKKNDSFRTLLLFPPVWTPVMPYLALPVLVAYLRKHGLSTGQYDASLDFFTKYLLTPDTLFDLLDVIGYRQKAGDYSIVPEDEKRLLRDLELNDKIWFSKISKVQGILDTMRRGIDFYQPDTCIRAQNDLYDLLKLASLAYYPAAFTFNTFSNGTISGFPLMLQFCDDIDMNPFLKFYSLRLSGKLNEQKPSLVGISVSTSHQLVGALTMARFIKKRYPYIHVTMGGKHVHRLKESFIREPSFFPEFCHSLIIDSGERPLKKLIKQLETHGTLNVVPNLACFDQNRLSFNEMGRHEPISELPAPDFSDLPLKDYLAPTPIIPIRLSEGCYWGKCAFCSRYDNKKFHTIPPKKAVSHMEALQKRYQVSCFTINDDCLTPTYLESFAQEILDKRLRFQISLWCKPVGSFTKKRMQALSRAGVRLIRWGVETGHTRILKLMNKGTNLKDTIRVLQDATDAGIWNHATMIIGFPTETIEEAKETIRFLERNQEIIHSSIFFRFVLLNHSHIIKHPEEFHIQSILEGKNPFSYEHRFTCSKGMDGDTLSGFMKWAQEYRIEEMYGHPFWYHLRIREYLLLYSTRYGLKKVRSWKIKPADLLVYPSGNELNYYFKKPDEISGETFEKICSLIESGGEVGVSWIRDNLRKAFLIGYATEQGRIVGTMTHKTPTEEYVTAIERKTQLNLHGYLERGYTTVRPEYRGFGIGDRLLKGLVERSPREKIYVTIRLDNLPAVRLTRKNNMTLAATYYNERTGHEIGVFTNQP